MLKVVFLQFCGMLIAIAISAFFFGINGALSALISGLSCVLPNGFFALRLTALSARMGSDSANALGIFAVGEILKVMSIIVLLILSVRLYPDLHWGAFLLGIILALKANLFALLTKT